MKRHILISMLLITVLTTLSAPAAKAQVGVSVSVSGFYDELAPYGTWVTVANYGEVWCPRGVVAGWQPYLNGRWVYTDFGWTWVSFDPWGGDPYHYGTWTFTADWGWVWIPGSIWAPAWVTWCDAGGYIGWAPVPPSFSIGLVGYSGPAVVASPQSYVFVPTQSFVGGNVQTARVDPARNATFVSSSQKTTSFAVSGGVVRTGGPPVARIQKVSGSPVRTVSLGVARTHAVPVARNEGDKRQLSVIAPRREQTALKREIETRGARPVPPALRAEPRQELQEKPPAAGKERPHEMKAAPPARQAEPPKENRKAQPIRKPEPQRESKAAPPARKPEPPHESQAQLSARKPGPPHEVKGNVPLRRPEPRPETKPEPSDRKKEPPHEAQVQAAARRAEPPHQVKAEPALRRAEPRHEPNAQPAVRRPEPPHQAKPQPPARAPEQQKAQKPQKPEKPEKNGG